MKDPEYRERKKKYLRERYLKTRKLIGNRKYKGEEAIKTFLDENNHTNIPQHKDDLCKNKFRLPFDNYLPDYKLLIEYDGAQHFEPGHFNMSLEQYRIVRHHDIIKNKFALENNYLLLRIAFTDFKYIKTILEAAILRAKKGEKGIIYSNLLLYNFIGF